MNFTICESLLRHAYAAWFCDKNKRPLSNLKVLGQFQPLIGPTIPYGLEDRRLRKTPPVDDSIAHDGHMTNSKGSKFLQQQAATKLIMQLCEFDSIVQEKRRLYSGSRLYSIYT